jgi:hypothetical protein
VNNGVFLSVFALFNIIYLIALISIKCKKKKNEKLNPGKQGKYIKKCLSIKKTMEFNWYHRFVAAGFIKISTFSFL